MCDASLSETFATASYSFERGRIPTLRPAEEIAEVLPELQTIVDDPYKRILFAVRLRNRTAPPFEKHFFAYTPSPCQMLPFVSAQDPYSTGATQQRECAYREQG